MPSTEPTPDDVHLGVRESEDVAVGVSEPEAFRSISSCTPSCVLTNRWPLPCRVVSAMDRRSNQRPNLLPVKYLLRSMLGQPPLFGLK